VDGTGYLDRVQWWALILTVLNFWVLLQDTHTHISYIHTYIHTRAICKVRGLTLLLRVETLWRYGDGLFFEVPPLESDALLTTLHPLLENVLQAFDHFEISCLGTPFSWSEKLRNRQMCRKITSTSRLSLTVLQQLREIHFFKLVCPNFDLHFKARCTYSIFITTKNSSCIQLQQTTLVLLYRTVACQCIYLTVY
jgi:hypothetical protein